MTVPAGWHPDPLPPEAGQPPQLRYWDGTRWTEHTSPLQQVHAGAYYGGVAAYTGPTTPDGAPLAGWWRRVAASLIDGIIIYIVSSILASPFQADMNAKIEDFTDEFITASDNGEPLPSFVDLFTDIWPTIVLTSLITLVVGMVWYCAWLKDKQATPGKMALGLQVRLRETPGPLAWGTVIKRWFAHSGAPGLLALIPIVGFFTFIYTILDSLWPLWDDNKQAIHDKVAKTNVVRVR